MINVILKGINLQEGGAAVQLWLTKKCCEVFLQAMQRHEKNVDLGLFGRHLQGGSDLLTGCK